jgi:Protein of unknown function (DUF1018)
MGKFMNAFAASSRAASIKRIHALRRELAMSADDAAVLQQTLTGVASSADMTESQREVVIKHLYALTKRGKGSERDKPRAKKPVLNPQQKKAWALWYALYDAKKISDKSGVAFRNFVKKQTGKLDLLWLDLAELGNLIEALKGWLERGQKPQDGRVMEIKNITSPRWVNPYV